MRVRSAESAAPSVMAGRMMLDQPKRPDAQGHRDGDGDEQRGQRELDRRAVPREDQLADGAVGAERVAHVAAQDAAPVIDVTVVSAVPLEAARAALLVRRV